MAIFQSTNPAISKLRKKEGEVEIGKEATYKGIAFKSIYFIVLTLATALISFALPFSQAVSYETIQILLMVSIITAFISGFVAMFFPGTTAVTGTLYAAAQGFMIGFVALVLTASGYGGEVFSALLSTATVFLAMMILYMKGVIRVGNGFKSFMYSAIIGVIVVNLIVFLLGLMMPDIWTVFYGNGLFSILVSVIMVVLASLMIPIDLNRMTEIVNSGLHKKYEWYAAFGLIVTLIWLYMEFLRLFLKFADRR